MKLSEGEGLLQAQSFFKGLLIFDENEKKSKRFLTAESGFARIKELVSQEDMAFEN